MTNKQERVIKALKKQMADDFFYGHDYEFKRVEVTESKFGTVTLVLETGLIGDENTLASVYARNRIQVFIGKRGGITYPVTYTQKNGKFVWAERRFHLGDSLSTIDLEQRHK